MADRITVAMGDGIGPEIMRATLDILEKANADIAFDEIAIGEKVYLDGVPAGIRESDWEILKKNGTFLKAPITTPQGGGVKSLNVTVRKTFGLYANVRPCIAYSPYIPTMHPHMNVVIVRENEEGLYGGIEHQQTPEMVQCLRLLSVPGCERICKYAFEYAKRNNRRKVTCFTKDNIMKQTDGLFHRSFDKIGEAYPEIEKEHWIIDIGTAKLADYPEQFDVIVVPNLYGDIISDVAAEITGSVGLAGSANIGRDFAMFEAIHGSAPDIAGSGIANPSGLLHGAIQMLVHLGQGEVASTIHNAWLKTIEDGVHTGDIYSEAHSKKRVGTQDFAKAVIERLGEKPQTLREVSYEVASDPIKIDYDEKGIWNLDRKLVGVDVFAYEKKKDPDIVAEKCIAACGDDFELKVVTNRGTKVWPKGSIEIFCVDHWCCRFRAKIDISNQHVADLLDRLHQHGLDFIKTEHLYTFDGREVFAKAQGE